MSFYSPTEIGHTNGRQSEWRFHHNVGESSMQPLFQTRHSLAGGRFAAVHIAAGLTLLLFALLIPGLPACTGMALVAFGATSATIERLGGSPARGPLLLAHSSVYAAIYLLFVGASLDTSSRAGTTLSQLGTVDLAVSLAVVILAARIGIRAVRTPVQTEL